MNRTYKKCGLVGAGGIGCFLAPMLCRLMDVVIIDADNYEPHNSTRQFPALTSVGNKAKVLSEHISPTTLNRVSFIESFLKGLVIKNEPEWEGVDIIFGGVDNNKSRQIIVDVADALQIPAIIAGNEHEHGEAHLFLPGVYDPFDFHEFPETEPTPWSCNSDKNLEENPQTPIANILAASSAMHLLLSLQKVNNPQNALAYSRSDALSSTSVRVKDYLSQTS